MTGGVLLNGEKIGLHAYPIGSIYMSTNPTSPAVLFGGGVWLPLTADAYFKIVTANAGVTGGQSDHKIPLASMPSHSHNTRIKAHTSSAGGYQALWWDYNEIGFATESAGGGNAYYPHYYGVYAWVRVEPTP